jgi:MurNAc alpha-1-phosphate uridylyltransferase
MPLPPAALADADMGHLVLVPRPAHKERGDFDLRNGRVCESDAAALTFSGVAVYRPAFFAGCKPGRFPLAPLLRTAARGGQLAGSLYEGIWEDVGTPERLAEVNRR